MASTEESFLSKVPSAKEVDLLPANSESNTKDIAMDGDTNTKNAEGVCPPNPNPAAETIFSLQSRLNEQQSLNRKLRQEKDKQLKDIAASLILLESRLRNEQKRLVQVLDAKDSKIAEQDRCIHALLTLNRRLSSRLAKVLHHAKEKAYCECNTPTDQLADSLSATDQNQRNTESSETSDDDDDDEDDDDGEEDEDDDSVTWGSVGEADLVPASVKRSLPNLRRGSAVHGTWSSSSVERTKMQCPKHPNVERLRRAAGVSRGPNLSVVYNRVMSNHRSVIKPKDVKYKKISRVKSRSLEELRGRLKVLSQPMVNGSCFSPPPQTNLEPSAPTPIVL